MCFISSFSSDSYITWPNLNWTPNHKRTGRVSFREAEVSCLNIFFHCLHENQVVLPEYYLIFCPKMAIWKILGGLQPPSALWAVFYFEGLLDSTLPITLHVYHEDCNIYCACVMSSTMSIALKHDAKSAESSSSRAVDVENDICNACTKEKHLTSVHHSSHGQHAIIKSPMAVIHKRGLSQISGLNFVHGL